MRWKLPVLLPAFALVSSVVLGADLSQVRALVEDGRAREALADLDQHLAEHPVDAEAMFLRGLVLAEVRREKEAREVFEEVSTLRPDSPEPLNNLAVVQAAMGDYDDAVETLKEALSTHSAYRTAYENLTKIYGQLASEAYSRALRADGARDRSALELVLLDGMVPKEADPVQVAMAPREPLPSSSGSAPVAAVSSSEFSDLADPMPTSPGGTSETPDQAIEAAVNQGRDIEAMPAEEDRTPMPAPASDAATPADLAVMVEAWARAWSQQRVEDYLSFYSSSFQPAGDMDREEWRQQRRARLAAPQYVKVSVAFLDFETTDSDHALVRFNQSYESDTFSDVVTKTLELVRQDGSWKIVRESVDS